MEGIFQKKSALKKSMGEKLILSGRYAISAVQLNCYLPLTVSHGELVMNFSSNTFIFQIMSTALIPLFGGYLASHSAGYDEMTALLGYTEKIIMTLISTSYIFVSIYFRVSGFLRRKSTLKFWQSNIDLCLEFNSVEGIELDTEFTKTRLSLRNDFIFLASGILSWSCGAVFLLIFFSDKSEAVGLSRDTGILLGQIYSCYILLSHGGQAIWLNFFIKLYVGMLNLIVSNLQVAGSSFRNCSSQITSLQLNEGIRDCYKLYSKVEKQVENFNNHFKDALILECLLGVLNTLGYAFVMTRWVREGSKEKNIIIILAVVIVLACGKCLYDLGTAGSRLSEAISRIRCQVHHLYQEVTLPFYLRLDLQMFATKTTNPPVLSVSQYFIYDRTLLTKILSTISTYLVILIQFRSAESK